MDAPKIYRELGVWMAEWPDGTFIASRTLTELEQHIDVFMASGCPLSRGHAGAYMVSVVCLVSAVVILGICAVVGVL